MVAGKPGLGDVGEAAVFRDLPRRKVAMESRIGMSRAKSVEPTRRPGSQEEGVSDELTHASGML